MSSDLEFFVFNVDNLFLSTISIKKRKICTYSIVKNNNVKKCTNITFGTGEYGIYIAYK